jgi:hypothetical protein
VSFSIFLKNLFFTLLQPGIVAGLVPCFLIKKIKIAYPDNSLLQNTVAIALGLAGLILMLDCIRRFATEGNCFIIFREEPRLLRDFGAIYGEYRKNVRRWL